MKQPLPTSTLQTLPADLPENWQRNQLVSPNGTDVGLTEQHGYNYLSTMINSAQKAIKTIDSWFKYVQDARVYTASSTDGINYTINNINAEQPQIGSMIIIKPSRTSASLTPALKIMSGSSYPLRIYNKTQSGTEGMPTRTDWLSADKPVFLLFMGSSWNVISYQPEATNLVDATLE